MDKVLIAIGGYLLYKVFTDKTSDITGNMTSLINTKGFLGMLLIFAVLMSFAQYAGKSLTWIPASLSAIIALGFWANK
jgi:uncharacterized membrane protein